MNFSANRLYTTVILTSLISALISVFLLFYRGQLYSYGDNVWPLSSQVFYNYEFFFSNINGGILSNNIGGTIFLLFTFTFLNQYSQIFSFFVSFFSGNFAISLLICKKILKTYNKIPILIIISTVISELFLSMGIDFYFELYLLNVTFIPIYATFPWEIYFIDSAILDNDNFSIKLVKLLIAALIQTVIIGGVLTLLLPSYLFITIFFFSILFMKNEISKKEKLYMAFIAILVIILLNVIPLVASYVPFVSNPKNYFPPKYYVGALEFAYKTFNMSPFNILTFSINYVTTISRLPIYYFYLSIAIPLLLFLGLIIRRYYYPTYIALILTFMSEGLWLSLPILFPHYINIYAKVPYLWSLDIPWLSFIYFLSLSSAVGIPLSISNFLLDKHQNVLSADKIIKVKRLVVIFLLILLVFTQILPFSVGYPVNLERQGVSFPNYLYDIANVIDNSSLFNPRIIVYPTSGVYLAYNFSYNDSYLGAGFWQGLLKGNVYASYFNYETQSIEWYITNYSNYNDVKPLFNAFQLLGINYIILTKNINPNYYFTGLETRSNLFNLINVMNTTLYNDGKKILFSNSQMTVYWFSNISLISVIKYIIAVNVSCSLFNQNYEEYQILTKALNLSFVNYSEAFIVHYKYLPLILEMLNKSEINYSVIEISPSITVLVLTNTFREVQIKLSGYYADYFTISIKAPNNPDLFVPLIIRYNYFPSKFIESNSIYYLIPGYSNETSLILVKANGLTYITINFSKDIPIINYYPLIYFGLIVFLSLYLIIQNIRKILFETKRRRKNFKSFL